jgi:hypothetical protein
MEKSSGTLANTGFGTNQNQKKRQPANKTRPISNKKRGHGKDYNF